MNAIVRQAVTVAVGVILILMAGIIALQRIPVRLTPNVEDTIISVTTFWEGASPQEVEQEIVDKQEDKLQGVANLRNITSTSQQGLATLKLEFAVGTLKEDALREVSDKLRQVPDYPENTDEPVVEASDPENRDYIAWFVLKSTDPNLDIRTLQDFAEDRLKPVLERVEGVSEVNVLGGREREVQVRYDPVLLAQRGITTRALIDALRSANRNVSAGDLADAKSSVRVRTMGQYGRVSDVEKTVVATTAGGPIFVQDVAEVVETYKEPTAFVHSRGEPVIAINAQKEVGSNVIKVMAGLQGAVDFLNRPGGIIQAHADKTGIAGDLALAQVFDQTTYIHDALDLVQSNIWIGGGLAMLVLLLFLRSLRSAGIVALAIPISVVGAVVVMVAMGRTINVVSLAGMAFAVGMVVDNAIVVLENIYRHLEMGKSPIQAAVDGSREVWGAILAATLTTIVVFIPVLLVKEEAGQLFRDIALAICAAVGLSLVVSITVIPTTAARLMRSSRRRKESGKTPSRLGRWIPLGRIPNFFSGIVYRLCGSVLARVAVVLILTATAAVGTYLLLPPADYLPQGNRNMVFGMVIPPAGYSLEQQQDLARRIEETVRPFWEAGRYEKGTPEYEAAAAALPEVPGEWGAPPVTPAPLENYFVVSLTGMMFHGGISRDPERAVDMKPLFGHATRGEMMPGILAFAMQVPLFRVGGRSGSSVKINLSGGDLDQVTSAALATFMALMEKYGPAATQPNPNNFNIPAPELQIHPKRVRLSTAGLMPEDLALAVQTNGDGAIIGEYRIGGESIDLKVIARDAVDQTQLTGLDDVPIATPTGHVVALSSVATLTRIPAPQQINRVDRQRSVSLELTPPAGMPLEQTMTDVDNLLAGLRASGAIPGDVETGFSGSASKLEAVQNAMLGDGTIIGTANSALGLALIVVYLVLCVLFQSFLRPLVIMFSVPLATLGGFIALAIVHDWSTVDPYMPIQNLDVLTVLGFVILIGVVVNNAILIVHQSLNFMRGTAEDAEGHHEPMEPRQAIAESVRTRVRPIFMGMFTSVGGMTPLVIMPGAGSELYRGLGSVVIGGLLVSTIFTLLLVPLLFSLLTDLQRRLMRKPAGGKTVKKTEPTKPSQEPPPPSKVLAPTSGPAKMLFFVVLLTLAGCTTPEWSNERSSLRSQLDDIILAEIAGLVAPDRLQTPTASTSDVEKELAGRRNELDQMAGLDAYEGRAPTFGQDLEGEPQKVVALTLEEVLRTTAKNNLDIQLTRLRSEVDSQDVIIAEADFDAMLFADSEYQSREEPRAVPVIGGVTLGRPESADDRWTVEAGVRKLLRSGATISARTLLEGLDNKTAGFNTSPDPAYRTGLAVGITQPLLRGFGTTPTTANVVLARHQREFSLNEVKAQLLLLMSAAEQAYWDLALARQRLLIRERLTEQGIEVKNLLEARRGFDTNMAEYADAVATVQGRQAELLRARRLVRATSDRMKIFLNARAHPLGGEEILQAADAIPTESLSFNLRQAVLTAIRERPEIEQALLQIDDASLREEVAENLRLPQLDLTTEVSYAGLDKDTAEAYDSLSRDDFFTFFVGFSFELPVGNRAADAEHQKAILERRATLVGLKQVVQSVITDVKTSLRDVETQFALIQATRSLRIAQSENLRAFLAEEETREAPTPEFLALKFLRQERLALAEQQEVEALTDYNRALADFHRAIGVGLERRRVEMRGGGD